MYMFMTETSGLVITILLCVCVDADYRQKGFSVMKGERGIPGIPGETGQKGEPGVPGFDGFPGQKGEQGAPGFDGFPGQKGEQGAPGFNGQYGQKGEPCSNRNDGLPGRNCVPGLPGPKGDRGLPGQRKMGNKGTKGIRGIDGVIGNPGVNGKDGVAGPRGLKGERGESGRSGLPGLPGLPGNLNSTFPLKAGTSYQSSLGLTTLILSVVIIGILLMLTIVTGTIIILQVKKEIKVLKPLYTENRYQAVERRDNTTESNVRYRCLESTHEYQEANNYMDRADNGYIDPDIQTDAYNDSNEH